MGKSIPDQRRIMIRSKSFYGWSVVVAAWLAIFCLFGYRATFSILKVPMSEDMAWSQTEVTLGYSLMMTTYAIAAFFCGMIVDKWGTRPVYAIGAVFGAAGFYITSLTDNLYAYYACYGILSGVGTGMMWVSSIIAIRKWYIGKNYARMLGIAFMGAPVAQLVMSLFVKQILLTAEGDGWRTAMQVLGVLTFVCMAIAALATKHAPENYGLTPYGEEPNTAVQSERIWTIKEAYVTYPIWGAIIILLTSMLAEFLIWTQVVSYWVTDLQLPLEGATNLYVVIGLSGIILMPLMGVVSDKVVGRSSSEAQGRKLMLIFGPLVGAISCTLLLFQNPTEIFIGGLACIIFAVYWAVVPAAIIGYAGAIYGRVSLGKVWGLATLIVVSIGPFVGPLIGGYLKDSTGSYTYSILFALGSFLVSALFATSLPMTLQTKPEQLNVPEVSNSVS
ncbi:MFS transporter [Shewanella sp. GXUN23E]|uniref:MFS transporter n=1 Tax=Shewanella sp. GXUN23E TaxID=3422498 RepID=UPI003D7C76A5